MKELCTAAECRELARGVFSMTLHAPQIAAAAQPGQFVHIACGEGNLLRRPISICAVGSASFRIVFQVKGEGTAWLSARREGDTLDVLGPLGHGYEMERLGARPVFIGGGIGVPPMLYTMRCARDAGAVPAAILGFRSQSAVILEAEFCAVGETTITTDDGSYGVHGLVSDVLQARAGAFTSVCACGPRPMLGAVAEIARTCGVPCQVSLEERMGCGVGACLVCACALKAQDGEVRYGHVCKDGPVFDAQEVAF